ncbi:MAG: PilN domain-containing protein [Thermodesulfovibrionales bacterium]
MIKVNLLPVKKKKKAKQIPGFLIATFLITVAVAAVVLYYYYSLNNEADNKRKLITRNEQTIAELDRKIKDVADFEKRNADYKARKDIIEKLGKSKTIPVKVIDEVSSVLPAGVWLTALDLKGTGLTLSCTGFSNTDVVNFVNNLKASKRFADVFLRESIQTPVSGYSVYTFSITLKVVS